MLFSTVLKLKLESYLQRIGQTMAWAVAIVDIQNNLILRNQIFDDQMLAQLDTENYWCKERVFLLNEPYFIIAKNLNGGMKKAPPNTFCLVTENINFIIQQEIEAQGLVQEVLEKYEELNLLYDMISKLSTIFDESKICQVVLERAMKVVDVSAGVVSLRNSRSNVLDIECVKFQNGIQNFSNTEALLDLAIRTVESGKEILYNDTDKFPAELLAVYRNPDYWQTLSVPISFGSQIIGALILVGKINSTDFNSGDIKLIDAIAGYAGITINSNRLVAQMKVAEALRHEMKLARNIQQSLLPKQMPNNDKFEIYGVCLPAADVGGDFFEVGRQNDSNWDIYAADVSGHGIGAALTMASLRSILRSESRGRFLSENMIKNVNQLMCDDTKDTGMYATLFWANFDQNSQKLFYTNAGHPVPLLWKAAVQKFERLEKGGMPVGMFEDENYVTGTTKLNSGDVLVIFTDGLTEAKNSVSELYDENRLMKVIYKNYKETAENILKSILVSVNEFQGDVNKRDDITIVILKIK